MGKYRLLIDGQLVDTENTITVINPATEKVFASCPAASSEQLDQAVDAATRAFPVWRDLSMDQRKVHLLKLADAVAESREALATVLTAEQGKSLGDARGEVDGTVAYLQTITEIELPSEVIRETASSRVELHRRPLGVVGAITPWNYPLLLAMWKIAQALVVGNTVVVKPSPYTPLTTLMLGELAKDIFPAGVVNILSGTDDLGASMTSHPGIRKITFTGSCPTGKKIMISAAANLKRTTLELGGNDAAIVLKDVNPKEVAKPIFWSAFVNNGQVCAALKRLYVHDDIYEELCAELKAIGEKVVTGDGTQEGVQLGPVQNRMQYEKVCRLVDEARNSGARILLGGQPMDRPGYFYPVTLVADVSEGASIVDEEQFGPVLPIIRYSKVDEAIQRANDTDFGLGGSVWSSDIESGIDVASRLECGTAWVNQHCQIWPTLPFGGVKESGVGVENSEHGLAEFTTLQVVNATGIYT
jgi:acyl-CoA reductase-like NAD-dependent aldehyde dehydrogenase